jgi:phosphatidylglycerophosphatase A
MRIPADLLSTFLGVGFLPVAPGTFASLIVAILYYFLAFRLGPLAYFGLVVVLFLAGVPAAAATARSMGRPDPRPIVIDEVVGQLLALAFAPAGWPWVLSGFLLFRIFDILKPFPIRRLERLPGGWGIMADDVLAGVFSAILLQAWLRL